MAAVSGVRDSDAIGESRDADLSGAYCSSFTVDVKEVGMEADEMDALLDKQSVMV